MNQPVKPPSGLEEPIPGYRLTDLLGRGGFGEVWRATAPGGIAKAVKLIHGDNSAGRANELNALNRVKDVRHPFLLSLERIEQKEGTLVIVMELGDKNLQEHYQSYREKDLPGIPQAELLTMLRDVADVLDFIYEEYALQHLDIKPANLLMFGKRLKLADFGLVKNIYERSPSLVAGLTPTYASPEVFDGTPSRASDQYSLAILYQELLTGVLPFDGRNAARLAAQHLRETPNVKPLPSEQQAVIARALSKNPQQRFPSCLELIEALTDAVRRTQAAVKSETPFAPQSFGTPLPVRSTPERRQEATSATPVSVSASPVASVANPSTFSGAPLRSPMVVVGVGSAAVHLMQRLSERIGDRLGGAAQVPTWRFVAFDTDPQVLNDIQYHESAKDAFETIVFPLRSSAEYRRDGAIHRRWMSRRWLYNIPRSLRTEGLRPLGRLALATNAPRVQSALLAAVRQVAAAAAQLPLANAAPRVLLVGSISGGTGGGMLLDLAYALRTILQKAGFASAEIDGLLLHGTSAGSGRDMAQLNALVTLQELLHYTTPGHFYPGEPLLEVPPFHGNNRTFRRADFLQMGNDLDPAAWHAQIDHAAEFVFARLATPLDLCRESRPVSADLPAIVDVVQVQQIGGFGAGVIEHLTAELCRDITNAWLGPIAVPAATTRTSSQSATLILNGCRNDRKSLMQAVASEAAEVVRTSGAEARSLQSRAHETLVRELNTDERSWLLALFKASLSTPEAVRQTDSVVAAAAIATLDQRLGIEAEDAVPRRPQQTLHDQLQARLASQAMQVSARITGWISELVDDSERGVDAAVCAAETCRQTVREINQTVTQELQDVRNRQTSLRIALSTVPMLGEAGKTGRNWLGGRSRNRVALEERLIQLGLLTFEELALVCVNNQLCAIESHVTAMMDQLTNLHQELRSLLERWGSATSFEGECDSEPIIQLLCDNRNRLMAELQQRIDRDVLAGPKKLQRFLVQRGLLVRELEAPLRRHARQVILQCTRRLISFLLQHGAQRPHEVPVDLDADIAAHLAETPPESFGKTEHAFVIAPQEAAGSNFETRLQGVSCPVTPIYAATNGLAIVKESLAVPLTNMIQQLLATRPGLSALAENLHTRIDVEWTVPDLAPAPNLDAILNQVDVPEMPSVVDKTMQLNS